MGADLVLGLDLGFGPVGLDFGSFVAWNDPGFADVEEEYRGCTRHWMGQLEDWRWRGVVPAWDPMGK